MRYRLTFAFLCLALQAAGAQVPASTSPQTIPPTSVAPNPQAPLDLGVVERVTVVADRGLNDVYDSATTAIPLTQEQLQQAPGLALDDRLHQLAGFTLFRRTSSWSANPTTEGVSLRGLGSTAASRTLVVSDQVPQNDPFGGWIHWNEIPTLAVASVNTLLGGSSDLYGSSAIGGVIDIIPEPPASIVPWKFIATGVSGGSELARLSPGEHNIYRFSADASGATQNSGLEDALLNAQTHYGLALAAVSGFQTAGYIPTAPAVRGPVDVNSNVNGESARIELRPPTRPNGNTFFLRGNLLNEARSNGTPLQTNATRLWRYQAGADTHHSINSASIRLFGSRESYRQSFSSIASTRNSETLTKLQHVPTDELGFALLASHDFRHDRIAAVGIDLRDVRATDDEYNVAVKSTTSISARQRAVGGYVDGVWQPSRWSFSGSIRVDSFRTFAAQQITSSSPTVTSLPSLSELVASPHIGVARYFGSHGGLTANAFRAFRGPTMNELYRTGQVGSQTTLANNSLLAERATGFEFGGYVSVGRFGLLSPSYFWTEVNRPVSAVLLSQTPTTQTLQRQNLGQIRSRGISLRLQIEEWQHLSLTASYQFANATVTAYNSSSPAQANLTGNWIPEVPHQASIATANYLVPHLANFHLIASYTGHVFDDAANQLVLHPYARFDISTDRALTSKLSVCASAQNLLNRSIDAGRTPVLTLASPRLIQAGLRLNLNR